MSTPVKSKSLLHEDWTVVVLGFLIIAFILGVVVVLPPSYDWTTGEELISKVLSIKNIVAIFNQLLLVFVVGFFAYYLTGLSTKNYLRAFPVIALLSTIALILAGNSAMKNLNLEAVIFSLTVGLLIGNLFKLPEWFKKALAAELLVKIGLVLLGTGVMWSDIQKAGSLGLMQALVVVVTVWYFAFWICRRFKLDQEFSMMLSSAVSICGVSAAIATAGAIQGDSKKLSYVISLVLVTAIPMMIFMPYLAQWLHLSQEVTGAWIGGTIDTTGAVTAAGSIAGETAQHYSMIVKMSQNVLLGLAAFAISVYWTYAKKTPDTDVEQPTLGLIWARFPKFVLGFIAASLLFSFFIPTETVAQVKGSLKSIQTLWFVLAFTSIGLETRFADLFNNESRQPLYAFLIAQTFNVVVTLLVALVLFG
ncbi:YeiH family protein [Pseudochryseolinea flava]|uniref:Putative sulfate exporter family transporter n=1 Tax=Pseudochryseolinea flava TaxID=2059302 RepID=A0A364Y1B9_9BACT|nr:putative sulfate exporter family transporter [Pseudochryseolinea flava]RAW00623.1 putative sulfate exporter family transporter [Pseudochryseolinea flava]